MNCEYCRCGLDDDEKVCTRCGAPNTKYMVLYKLPPNTTVEYIMDGVPKHKVYGSTSFDDESWFNPRMKTVVVNLPEGESKENLLDAFKEGFKRIAFDNFHN